ncbi:MAG: 23S rRNA (uracil(1939)-C(5))-methyltransferase RlmD [Thermodesulfobacteriota bacterium]
MNQELVIIEKLVVGGKGLARLANGLVVLVPFVIPGEKVRVRLGEKKKSFQHGLVEEVVEPSPDRVTPPCPYFGRCGGCQLQHIDQKRQDVLKKDIFCDGFRRAGLHFNEEAIHYLSSPRRLGYRQRIRLHVQDGELGFFQQGSHRLLEIDECLLARPEINALLQELDRADPWLQVADQVAEVEVHANPDDLSCLLIINMKRKPRPRDLASLKELVTTLPGLSSLLVKSVDGTTYTSFPERMGKIRYHLGACCRDIEIGLEPGGFCQVNEEQNQQMVDQVLAWLQDEPKGRLLDLFCGVGNFSLPLTDLGFAVTGIDQQRSAIRSAEKNGKKNNLNCDFRRAAAQDGLEKIVNEGEMFDYVLLDPPRAGFKEGSALLAKLHASQIIYVSCDQATLFRDLKAICAGGYKISAITLVDQFCQSHHLESMVLLTPA